MSRPLRKIKANVTYHVGSRCHNLKDLMKSKKMKRLLVQVVNNALELYSFEISSYTIVDNHFHFLIKTIEGEATISEIMQYIKSQYARKYNKLMNRKGAFWNERFFDKIIEDSEDPAFYCNWVTVYIGYNPVRKKYVRDPREYEFSSINAYFNEFYESPIKITLHQFFNKMGNTFYERKKRFLEYEEMYRKRLFPAFLC